MVAGSNVCLNRSNPHMLHQLLCQVHTRHVIWSPFRIKLINQSNLIQPKCILTGTFCLRTNMADCCHGYGSRTGNGCWGLEISFPVPVLEHPATTRHNLEQILAESLAPQDIDEEIHWVVECCENVSAICDESTSQASVYESVVDG